jgi:hypothetical protein
MISKLKIKIWFKQLFCWHDFRYFNTEYYNIFATNDPVTIRGELEVYNHYCQKCPKKKITFKSKYYTEAEIADKN